MQLQRVINTSGVIMVCGKKERLVPVTGVLHLMHLKERNLNHMDHLNLGLGLNGRLTLSKKL